MNSMTSLRWVTKCQILQSHLLVCYAMQAKQAHAGCMCSIPSLWAMYKHGGLTQ